MTTGNRKSFLLVTVDCLRADHVGFMGYGRPTTPFLDSLAKESFMFPTAVVAGAPTYYSFPAIMSSQYPLAMGRDVLGLASGEPSLATVLKEAGYATAAFGAANPYISGRFGYDHGFDTFKDFLGSDVRPASETRRVFGNRGWASKLNRRVEQITHQLGPVRAIYDELYFQYCQRLAAPRVNSMGVLRRFPSAEILVDQARAWLVAQESPFFLWIHLMDPHAPYYPHDDALQMMGNGSLTPFRARYLNSCWNRSDLPVWRLERYRDDVVALYDAGVRWVDAQLARLVDTLRETAHWDNCIVAFTADHGEEFLEHGGRYHPPSRLMEELIHVPLLLRVPEFVGRKLPNSPFSLLHLAPTLLDAAQLAVPVQFQGQSYWPHLRDGTNWDGTAIAECVAGCTNPLRVENRLGPRVLVIRENRYKLMVHFDPFSEYLYDLEADPTERAPVPKGAERTVRRRLLEHAREHLEKSETPDDPKLRVKARLRDLRLEWTQPVRRFPQVAS